MFIPDDDLDNTDDSATDDDLDDAKKDDGENQDDAATNGDDQQSDDAGSDVNWEERYKGLQRASEKKRKQLEDQLATASTELETTVTELETVKGDTGSLEQKKVETEEAKEKLETDLKTLEKERENLQTQIDQQAIVMTEFPQLTPVAKFIPAGGDLDSYRASAKELSDALGVYTDKGVTDALKGASATFKEGEDDVDTPTQTEIDKAWKTVYTYAGDPAHVDEVAAAQALIDDATADEPDL